MFHTVDEIAEKKKEDQPLMFRLTPGEQETLKAVEESIAKKGYRTKLRFIYVGRREGFDRGFFPASTDRSSSSMTRCSILSRTTTKRRLSRTISGSSRGCDMPSAKFSTAISTAIWTVRHSCLNSEELATVYHMPDMSVLSPAISRVEAKKGGAPINLPIE